MALEKCACHPSCPPDAVAVVGGGAAGKYFGLDMWIGTAIGAALMYPTINNPELSYQTVQIFGFIPLQYQPYAQTVFPSTLSVMLAAKLFKVFEKVCPKAFAVGFALTWITNFDNKAEAAA